MHAIRTNATERVEAVRRLIRWPAEPTKEWSAGFLSGIFDAEGSFSQTVLRCYARPSHAFVGLSPGLDFETRLFAKENAAELLREEISRPGYRCEPIMLGANTDCYQPIERTHRITRSILEVLAETHHPASIMTSPASSSRERAPRAGASRRFEGSGRPASAEAGATGAGYTLLRLPWEVRDLFKEWLEHHAPLKAGARLGLNATREWTLDTGRFVPPAPEGQGSLF